jgi:hypothetical protein
MQPVKISGFKGLNNVQQSTAFLANKGGLVTPRLILNADITTDKTLTKRGGYTKLYSLTNAHSLSKNCSVLLCIADNKLCKLSHSGYTEICDMFSDSMSYAEIENCIYMSSPTWTGKYNLLTGGVEDWGIELPLAPEISLTSGNLPPGRYSLCYTKQANKKLSGNGPIREIEFEGGSQGIALTNYQDSYLCWITDTDGKDFYLADVQSDKVISQHYNVPLQSLFVIPPPKMSVISYAFGRIWGIEGKKLYYSEPNAFEWFKEANHFPFPDHLVMIAFTPLAIFVASRDNTWVLIGTDPDKMIMSRVGDGTIPGCSETGEFQQSGQEIPTWRHKSILPIWLSPQGFTVGNEHNYLTNLTEDRLSFTLGRKAATLQRMVNGQMQILVTMPVSLGILGNIFKLGRAFLPAPLEMTGSGGVTIS